MARRTEVKVNGEQQQVSAVNLTKLCPKGEGGNWSGEAGGEGFIFPGIWGTAAHKGGCGRTIRGGNDPDRGRSPLPDKQTQNCPFKAD